MSEHVTAAECRDSAASRNANCMGDHLLRAAATIEALERRLNISDEWLRRARSVISELYLWEAACGPRCRMCDSLEWEPHSEHCRVAQVMGSDDE